ncbi:hypothetical protein [Mesonia aestuariivivens]|uniref:Uncharacterized protein n=1 Tax=Mesonia aestuariivivens TaxID=2796128 RepID=A0ABS6W0B4_9FLAO|nr:hypothetical protein [Mesonia aestuariivivens]MBW2961275.1 hypothetical protein [Mesonia aestuariivivens]
MVNTYELISQLEKEGMLKKLLGKGIVPIRYLNDKEMYERFLELMEEGQNKMDAYFKTSIEFKCSSKTVERVVIKMES